MLPVVEVDDIAELDDESSSDNEGVGVRDALLISPIIYNFVRNLSCSE